jgi:hypothetical protein
MAEKLDPKEIVTLEELALSNMWETSALVELLERKGILKKQSAITFWIIWGSLLLTRLVCRSK